MLLADQGASVVKVVDRSPEVDSLARSVYDRGKDPGHTRSQDADGVAAAREYVDRADVVIENFRPGVMDRLGLGAEDATARNPGLVYLSLPGFARRMTRRRCAHSSARPPRSSRICVRSDAPMPLGSTYGALHGVIAVARPLPSRGESRSLSRGRPCRRWPCCSVADGPPARSAPSPLYGRGGDGKWMFWIASGHSRWT